jgi:hypothetical protein
VVHAPLDWSGRRLRAPKRPLTTPRANKGPRLWRHSSLSARRLVTAREAATTHQVGDGISKIRSKAGHRQSRGRGTTGLGVAGAHAAFLMHGTSRGLGLSDQAVEDEQWLSRRYHLWGPPLLLRAV